MHDLIVIGAGPAGLGAALQATHYGLDVLVLERDQVGGRVRYADEIGNFPGFTAARTTGAALVKKLRTQAQLADMRIVNADCELIDWRRPCFIARTARGDHRGRAVIVATGVRPVPLSIPGAALAASRIHYYWSDIPSIRGKSIAVIGAGEVAFDQACSLARRGASVTILARGNVPGAFPGLITLARRLGIRVRCNAPVSSIATASRDRVALTNPGGRIVADHVLVAIGSAPLLPPMTADARNRIDRGVYLAGDAAEVNRRQAVIAFGDGVQQAMQAYSVLKKRELC